MTNQEVKRDSSLDIPIANLLHGKIDQESGQIISKIIREDYNKRRSLCKELLELENPNNPETKALDSDTKLKNKQDIRNSIFKINKSLYTTIEQMRTELIRIELRNSSQYPVNDTKIRSLETKLQASQFFIKQRIELAALMKANYINSLKDLFETTLIVQSDMDSTELMELIREKNVSSLSKEPNEPSSPEQPTVKMGSNIEEAKSKFPAISNQDVLISYLAIYDLDKYEGIIEIIMNHYAKTTNPLSTPNPEEY